MLTCSKCKTLKPPEDFSLDTTSKRGYQSSCKACHKLWRQTNSSTIKERDKLYRKNNLAQCRQRKRRWLEDPNNLKKQKNSTKKWVEVNKESRNERERNKRKDDIMIRLHCNVGSSIRQSLYFNGLSKRKRPWEKLVSYQLAELKTHLESKFEPGMNWDNYGKKGWVIDHIKPICSFKFASTEDKEFTDCWALANLRPLWEIDNLKKSAKDKKLSKKSV